MYSGCESLVRNTYCEYLRLSVLPFTPLIVFLRTEALHFNTVQVNDGCSWQGLWVC